MIFTAQGNENITWETNTNFNVGAEFDLFKGRLSGSFEYFYRKTTDMLFAFPVAPSMGYSSYYANIGDMRNSGIELNLNAVLLNRKNVQWNFGLNLTHYKNKIDRLPPEKMIDGGYVSGDYWMTEASRSTRGICVRMPAPTSRVRPPTGCGTTTTTTRRV